MLINKWRIGISNYRLFKSMPQYSTSISINASQADTWQALADVSHWHEWTPTVAKVEVLDQPGLKLNHRYKVYQPKLQPATWTITVLTPPAGFTWESRAPGMVMRAEHTLKSIGANQIELALKFSFQGLLGELIGRLYRGTVQSYIATEAQSLKKRVENP